MHKFRTPNLYTFLAYALSAKTMLLGLNQVWVADITHIRLAHEFVYLAAILDAHSRRVIGWNLSQRLDVHLTLTALHCALQSRAVSPGLIHHSDRGIQYAAKEVRYDRPGGGAGAVDESSRPPARQSAG